jgi:hypothetical protein
VPYEPDEWKSNMPLANTVLPWTTEWLYYYEIWLVPGEWTGGGDWPGVHGSEPLATACSNGARNKSPEIATKQRRTCDTKLKRDHTGAYLGYITHNRDRVDLGSIAEPL